MKKITFIGAGSLGFTQGLVRDILTYKSFNDAEICLMDIHEGRLNYAKKAVEKLISFGKYKATVTATTNRKEALEGACGVLITILQGGVDVWRHDIEIPKAYGIDICVGDTRGPSGIFRFLRTAPVMLDIIKDIEVYCPNAVVINYTNPMALLCGYLQRQTKVQVTGLCHSVQGTARLLASWLGLKEDEVTYTCAGINHQAFYLDFKHKGIDVYPQIKQLVMDNQDIYNQEQVRNEMFINLDYYPTESSGHNSEYNPWFRKRQDLIEKYCTNGTGWNPGHHAFILKEYEEKEHTWEKQFNEVLSADKIDLNKGEEYAAGILNALYGDGECYEFNGNVPNYGIIDNLPYGACVEVPVMVSPKGIRPFKVGNLPDNLAVMINTSSRCEELAIKGAIEGDPWKIFQAILFDPLTSSVISMSEIKAMTKDMFKQNEAFLSHYMGALL